VWCRLRPLSEGRTAVQFKGATAVVLVFDITNAETYAHCATWLQEVLKHQPSGRVKGAPPHAQCATNVLTAHTPGALVATKCDLDEYAQVTDHEAQVRCVAPSPRLLTLQVAGLRGDERTRLLPNLRGVCPRGPADWLVHWLFCSPRVCVCVSLCARAYSWSREKWTRPSTTSPTL
jgi:hypothetical protein